MAMTESQHRINALASGLSSIDRSTKEAGRCCDHLSRLARQLDSLTSPASDASAVLTQASENLASTLRLVKDAREKFDTVQDCEPAIQRLTKGAKEAVDENKSHGNYARKNKLRTQATRRGGSAGNDDEEEGDEVDAAVFASNSAFSLTEQDVYAAADSMDILRDAYAYFLERPHWKSTPGTLRNLERVHKDGVDAMCLLIHVVLAAAGPAVRIKRKDGQPVNNAKENAHETTRRLAEALQNRDLMKSVGEYENFFPLETRPFRELRAIMECLSGVGSYLGPEEKRPKAVLDVNAGTKVVRTEKVGSGFYCNLTKVRSFLFLGLFLLNSFTVLVLLRLIVT